MSNLLTLRNIVIGLVVIVLAVAIPVSVRLAQEQTRLKSLALSPNTISVSSTTSSSNGVWLVAIDYNTTSGGYLFYQNQGTCSSPPDCLSKFGYDGWTEIYKITNDGFGSKSWNPQVGDIPPGNHTIVLFDPSIANILSVANSNFLDSSGGGGSTGTNSLSVPSSITSSGGVWSVTIDINTTAGGIVYYQNNEACSSVSDCFNKYGYNGWTEVDRVPVGRTITEWKPSTNDVSAGTHTFGLFNADSSTLLAIANTNFISSGGGGGTGTLCTPNSFDPNLCRVCSSDGTFWGAAGSDYGPQSSQTQWCSCAQKYASDYSTSSTYSICRGSGGTGTVCTPGSFDPASCRKCADDGTFWGNSCSDYGPQSNQSQWCACGQKCASDYSTSPTYAVCRSSSVCTPSQIVGAPECRQCNSSGTGYFGDRGSYFPGAEGSADWCACSKIYNDPAFYEQKCGTQTGAIDAAECKSIVIKKDGEVVTTITGGNTTGSSLKLGETYDVEITMDNKDYNTTTYQGPTWTVGNLVGGTGYFLGFPTQGDSGAGNFLINTNTAGSEISINSLWQVNWPDATKLRIPVGTTVVANGSHTFKFTITPQKIGFHTFYWGMVHEGVSWFGGQCTPKVNVEGGAGGSTPTPTPTPTTQTCNDVAHAGGQGVDTREWEMGQTQGWFKLKYDMYAIPDKMDIYYENKDIYTTGQEVDGSKSDVPVTFGTGNSTKVKVVVTANQQGTAWEYQLSCPQSGTPPPTSTPTPSPSPVPTLTACYFYSENLLERDSVDSCSDPKAIKYEVHPTKLTYTFANQNPGVKTIFARFISNTGQIADMQKSIRFEPKAALTNIQCSFASSGVGTLLSITGTNLGAHTQQGSGGLFIKGQKQTTTWIASQNTINIQLNERIEGEIPVIVKNDDGVQVSGSCTVGLSTLAFETNLQCRKPGQFASQNVDLRLYENRPGLQGVPQPIIAQEIALNSNGVPVSFAPKLEVGKIYTLIIKPPQGIARKIDFRALPGTTIIPTPIVIPLGDTFPVSQPDGKITAQDYGLMVREWSLIKDVSRPSDLYPDKRVNSVDYACLRSNFQAPNNEDDVFEPVVLATPRPSTQATPTPASTLAPSPSPSPSASPVAQNEVQIKDLSFSPATLTIKASEKVTWINQDSAHSATADDNSFDTGVLSTGQSASITFNTAGTYTYHCSVHPTMKGTIVVQ